MSENTFEKIYAVVARIPRGRVATYGQIARLAGLPRQARQVGYALAATTEDRELPWHRVINAKGEVSRRANPYHETVQQAMLEQEGVRFDERGRVALEEFSWDGKSRR